MSNVFSAPVHPETAEGLSLSERAKDHFWIGTPSEFIDFAERAPDSRNSKVRRACLECTPDEHWSGSVGFDEAIRYGRDGDLAAVEQSEPLLTELEEMFPAPTARRAVVDDVVGGFPNVSAYIAGTPLTMRRRVKRESEFAPLAITVNLMCSAGINVEDVRKRGVAILALVRALSARRPVELYCGLSCCGPRDERNSAAHVYFRIDTAPLDLAHAAFFLAHPVVVRCMLFNHAREQFGTHNSIPWPYDRYSASREFLAHAMRRAFPHVDDVLCIPGMQLDDEAATNSVAWIAEHVKRYGGEDFAADYQVAA